MENLFVTCIALVAGLSKQKSISTSLAPFLDWIALGVEGLERDPAALQPLP